MPRSRTAEGSCKPDCARGLTLALAIVLMSAPVAAQDAPRIFTGALFGVSTLSADARSVTTPTQTAVSLYEPHNGPALNLFAGIHIAQYFSIQANWMWNRGQVFFFL